MSEEIKSEQHIGRLHYRGKLGFEWYLSAVRQKWLGEGMVFLVGNSTSKDMEMRTGSVQGIPHGVCDWIEEGKRKDIGCLTLWILNHIFLEHMDTRMWSCSNECATVPFVNACIPGGCKVIFSHTGVYRGLLFSSQDINALKAWPSQLDTRDVSALATCTSMAENRPLVLGFPEVRLLV
jgi:hypothetical protein